jgi:cathepsin B
MFKLTLVGTIVAVAVAHPICDSIVNEIKQKTSQWVPHEVETNPFSSWSLNELKGLFGTVIQGPAYLPGPSSNAEAPASFDAREKWGTCVHPIRDQAKCGSCWAFAGSETMSDRVCIASGGKTDVVLSPQDMVSCDSWNQGCNGGILSWAWSYIANTGLVSDSCFPYTS